MFKRLRVRFIALSMASLLLVLGVILGAANWISYRHVVQEADKVLDILAENGGAFPHPEGGRGSRAFSRRGRRSPRRGRAMTAPLTAASFPGRRRRTAGSWFRPPTGRRFPWKRRCMPSSPPIRKTACP